MHSAGHLLDQWDAEPPIPSQWWESWPREVTVWRQGLRAIMALEERTAGGSKTGLTHVAEGLLGQQRRNGISGAGSVVGRAARRDHPVLAIRQVDRAGWAQRAWSIVPGAAAQTLIWRGRRRKKRSSGSSVGLGATRLGLKVTALDGKQCCVMLFLSPFIAVNESHEIDFLLQQ